MTKITNHSTKVNRALRMSVIGDCPSSASAMLAAIPGDVIAALPARLIAGLLDANWALANDSKEIAAREAISDGAIWDSRKQRLMEIAP